MEPGQLQLRVEVGLEADADAQDLDDEAAQLRRELLELDVDVERPTEGPAPPGTKAVEVAILGTLLVGLSREAIAAVVRTIESWASRRPDRSVRLEIGGDSIVVPAASDADKQRLVQVFVDNHGAEAP
jgi:hypothetical protein